MSDELLNRFSYHPPQDEETKRLHERVRAYLLHIAEEFEESLPDSREKSLVFTKLDEAMFWANAAIARHPRD